jgi:3-oxoacyl-[acyl-carrier protein] reductase
VVLTYVSATSENAVDAVIHRIRNLNNGSDATKVRIDLHQIEAPETILSATFLAFPSSDNKVDILVNNAAQSQCKSLADTKMEDYTSMFDVNVRSTIFMTKAVLPYLRAPGRIINITSIAARRGSVGFSIYSATKAAVEGFTRALACELGPYGHTVNSVAPGAVEPGMFRGSVPEELVKYILESTPLKNRVGTPEDIAPIVTFLADAKAGWLTGQTLCPSGGLNMV